MVRLNLPSQHSGRKTAQPLSRQVNLVEHGLPAPIDRRMAFVAEVCGLAAGRIGGMPSERVSHERSDRTGTRDLQAQEGDNDDLVPVASATAGSDVDKWSFLGNWEANHFRLVNWGTDIVPTPAELRDNTILKMYRSIVARVVGDQASEER
jgi:hypothetical protein